MDRKEFFYQAFHSLLAKGVEVFEKTGAAKKLEALTEEKTSSMSLKLRPPGAAANEAEFLAKCTGCDACMKACPVNIIMIEDLERRDPVIFPESGPCIHCPGYPCISSCPAGALDRQNGFKLRMIC